MENKNMEEYFREFREFAEADISKFPFPDQVALQMFFIQYVEAIKPIYQRNMTRKESDITNFLMKL